MNTSGQDLCYNCKDTCRNTLANPCEDCEVSAKTRAEQIRMMTDTELAAFLKSICQDGCSGTVPSRDWLEWLRQKAK